MPLQADEVTLARVKTKARAGLIRQLDSNRHRVRRNGDIRAGPEEPRKLERAAQIPPGQKLIRLGETRCESQRSIVEKLQPLYFTF